MAITDFMKTDIPKEELAIALKVLKHFKSCESRDEWLAISFAAWAKLEQLEEFLDHMVDEKDLKEDTIEYMAETHQ